VTVGARVRITAVDPRFSFMQPGIDIGRGVVETPTHAR